MIMFRLIFLTFIVNSIQDPNVFDPQTDKFFVLNSTIIANNPKDTDFSVSDFLRLRLFNHSYILENLIERKISLDHKLLIDFQWYFSIRGPGNTVLEKLSRSNSFASNDEFLTSADGASKFCCTCYLLSINCPVCLYNDVFYCEFPFENYSKKFLSWHQTVYLPSYSFVSIREQDAIPHSGISYIFKRHARHTFNFLKIYSGTCKPVLKSVKYLHGEPAKDCVKIIDDSTECPLSSGTFPPNSCDWSLVKKQSIDKNFAFCYAPFKTDLEYKHTDGRFKYFCNSNGLQAYHKSLYHYITQNDDVMNNTLNWKPNFLARSGNTFHFSIPDFSDFNGIIERMIDEIYTPPHSYVDAGRFIKMPIICDGSYSEISPFFNGEPSWIGNKLIHPLCSRYVEYNYTHMICYDSLFLKNTLYCGADLFRTKPLEPDPVIYFTLQYDLEIANEQSNTCEVLNNTGYCSFNDLFSKYYEIYKAYDQDKYNSHWSNIVSYFEKFDKLLKSVFINFTKALTDSLRSLSKDFMVALQKTLSQIKIDIYPALNKSLDNAVNNMLNMMGMNDKNLFFYEGKCENQCKYGAVGNWLSGIFYSLIEPFFKAFIDVVVKSFLLPLIQGFTMIITDLIEPLQELSDVISKAISQLALVITKLLVVLFQLIIGIIIFIESYLLLFEYVVLYLFIMKYIVTDFSFALVVVLVFSVVFGIVRKSPSFLITVMNPDFMLFDLSHYYTKEFDYNYTFGFAKGSILYIFSLVDFNATSVTLY